MIYSCLWNVITHSLMLQFKQNAIFLQVALPMLMFSNKTVIEARNNPASFFSHNRMDWLDKVL